MINDINQDQSKESNQDHSQSYSQEMELEQVDKALANLYQQRKASVIAPSIVLADKQVKPTRSNQFARLLMLTGLGGAASFGVLALMTHFAKQVPVTVKNSTTYPIESVPVEIADVKPPELELAKPKLPPKPMTPNERIVETARIEQANTNIDATVTLGVNGQYLVSIPTLTEPKKTNVKPIVKVMPEYKLASDKDFVSGFVKFSYKIDEQGKVVEIVTEEATVSRELKLSAKKALRKWRYDKSASSDAKRSIVFEFEATAG